PRTRRTSCSPPAPWATARPSPSASSSAWCRRPSWSARPTTICSWSARTRRSRCAAASSRSSSTSPATPRRDAHGCASCRARRPRARITRRARGPSSRSARRSSRAAEPGAVRVPQLDTAEPDGRQRDLGGHRRRAARAPAPRSRRPSPPHHHAHRLPYLRPLALQPRGRERPARRRRRDRRGPRRLPLALAAAPEPLAPAEWPRRFAEAPRLASRPPTVLCVARMYPRKRLDVLLRAGARLRGRIPGVRVRIVGDGPESARLRALSAGLGLEETVTFLGEISRSALAVEYVGADCFCLPTVQEGFGLVFAEAMAAGLPIVACRTAAVPEVVEDGRTGLLVSPNDPDRKSVV